MPPIFSLASKLTHVVLIQSQPDLIDQHNNSLANQAVRTILARLYTEEFEDKEKFEGLCKFSVYAEGHQSVASMRTLKEIHGLVEGKISFQLLIEQLFTKNSGALKTHRREILTRKCKEHLPVMQCLFMVVNRDFRGWLEILHDEMSHSGVPEDINPLDAVVVYRDRTRSPNYYPCTLFKTPSAAQVHREPASQTPGGFILPDNREQTAA